MNGNGTWDEEKFSGTIIIIWDSDDNNEPLNSDRV